MDFTYLRTFREVARTKNITKAAEELGYAQSSVTTQIQKLEREYGVPLLERYGRRLRLTPPGETLLKLAVQILDLHEQSKEQVANQLGGTLRIGTIDSLAAYYLPPHLQQLKQQLDGTSIQLLPESEAALVAKVKEGEYDVGLLLDSHPADPALRCVTVREEPLVLIAHPDHPLVRSRRVELQELQNMEWIVSEPSCIYRGMFETLLKTEGIAFRIAFELGNLEAIKQCVVSGLGAAVIPKIAVQQELATGNLGVIPFSHPELRLDLQLIVHPQKWMSHSLLAFIRLLTGEEQPSLQPSGVH
jgi:DNA-binding transcriptional LysR family regulator